MNPWWLLLIVPGAGVAGFLLSCFVGAAACQECKEAMEYRQSKVDDKAFNAGLKEGLARAAKAS